MLQSDVPSLEKPQVTFSVRELALRGASGVFVFLAVLTLMDPSLAHGHAVGFSGVLFLWAMLALSVAISALPWFFVARDRRWTWPKGLAIAAVILATSILVNQVFAAVADLAGMGDRMSSARIEYFCFENFDRLECVRQVNLCPECAHRMDRWKRDEVVQKLKTPGSR